MSEINCSVGVFAYNEEKNISFLLNALVKQRLKKVNIREIIVVSSASTDKTDEIVEDYSKRYSHIKLIKEEKRNGKSAAINLFLKNAISDILVIESGDTIPEEDTIEKMVSAFECSKIGMSGGRPVPVNSSDTFTGYMVNLLWRLHHEMALVSPKLGEMVAFRKIFSEIPPESAVDEASIEALVTQQGYKLAYLPEAIIHNKGPENIADFVKQRKRIAAGHCWLNENQSYIVTSSQKSLLFKLFLKEFFKDPPKFLFLLATVCIEIYCRVCGIYDYKYRKNNPYKWDIAESTKNPCNDFLCKHGEK
ncbi:MAG: glycosyltransferase [Candidatus Cloacimonetes bacterium]|nr:glycosyltransferase [Candidatus Cloacimonadota bacterium]